MKSLKNIFAAAGVTLLSMSLFTACDKDKLLTDDYPEAFPTTEITFKVSDILPLGVGMDSTIVYTVGPEAATDKSVIFSSSNPDVATVDNNGKIKAISIGEATISAVPIIGFGANAQVEVHVIDHVIKASEVILTALTEPSDEGFYYETDEIQLKAEILPADHTYDHVTWTSMDESIATVDENGLVYCIKEGDAHIRCHTHDHSGIAGDYHVHIYKMQEVQSLEIKPVTEPICVNQGAFSLDVTYYPLGATIGSVEWTSSDESVATVKRGVVTPKSWGTTVITAMAPSGESASVSITVESGWYVWDSSFGWANWHANDCEYRDGYIHVPLGLQNNGKWRNDLSYTNPGSFPFDWASYNILAMRLRNLADGGNNTLDYNTPEVPKANFRGSRAELSDGTALIYWDGMKKYGNMISYGSPLNIKIADIPGDRYTDAAQAYYDILWIRTFKTLDDAKAFAEAEIAQGK